MSKPDLWTRLKQARTVQVLLVYLGVCWGILQGVDVLQSTLSLPEWVGPVAVILLLIGFIIILATGWVQSLPSTNAREAAGEVPTDWQIAPKDLGRSLISGRLPHLNWGRAILGGVVALSLLFGASGLFVLLTGGRPSFGPPAAGADLAPTGIAVVPFEVVGGDLEFWREGMVDVLSTNLDGMGGYRTIDSRTVLARWNETVDGRGTPDLRTSLQVAGSTGARFGLVGNMLGTPVGIRVNADIYDLDSGEKVVQSWIEGPEDRALDLVGELSVDLTRKLLEASGEDLIQAPRTASLTTHSLPALRSYLEGEAAFRKTDFAGAVAAFERAVEIDSTFALAWYRLGDSYGWLEDISSDMGAMAGQKAVDLADQLPARDQVLVRADLALTEGDLGAVRPLQDAVRNYPDDPHAWYLLGEFYLHHGLGMGMATREETKDAFERAYSLDPTFLPYQVHRIETAILTGDTARAREALGEYDRLAPGEMRPYLGLMFDLYLTDPTRREAVFAGLDTMDLETVRLAGQWGKDLLPDQAWVEEVSRKAYELTNHNFWWFSIMDSHLARGEIGEAVDLIRDLSGPPGLRYGYAIGLRALGVGPTAELEDFLRNAEGCDLSDVHPSIACIFAQGWLAAVEGDRETWQARLGLNQRLIEDGQGVPGAGPHVKEHESAGAALEGFWARYQTDDRSQARRLLEESLNFSRNAIAFTNRWTLLDVYGAERPRDALRMLDRFEGIWWGYGRVRAGQLYEETGNVADAIQAYRSAVETFQTGDPDNPYLLQAREALERLES
jgi:tetratricopeptide (TPR) repeat protein